MENNALEATVLLTQWHLKTGFKASKCEEVKLFPQAPVTLNIMKGLRFACLHAALPPLNLTLKGEFDFLRIKQEGQTGCEESRTRPHLL